MRPSTIETFTATLLPAWVNSNFATSGTEDDLLIGFSKSGYGALDLLFKHPAVFDAAAAWDFPADMTAYKQLWGERKLRYRLEFSKQLSADRHFHRHLESAVHYARSYRISGYDVFQTDVSDFDALLTSHGVLHTLSTQTYDAHNWSGGWLSGAVAGLYALVDGDGTIGPPAPPPPPAQTVIEGFGSTSLTEVGTHFYLYGSGGTGPSLKYQGADYVAGQFGQVAPIGAEQTASGYEVAWKAPGADQFSVWNTDNNGNYLSNTLTSVSGTSAALQSIEASFHQDLNGDGTIGPPALPPPAQTVIEGFGSTSLTEVGTHFYLYGSDGTGPSLKYQGADYVAGQFGQVAPIGAEQTASGYEVAWKATGADQFSVWNTDNNGNYLSNTLTSVSGTSAALQSFETSFHQDLNGDGTIGPAGPPPPPAQTVIEGFGSTSLTEVGTHFYLYGSGGTGPSLKYQGADYVAGQFGQVAPIGAEQTASGYEVAWKATGADQFSVWNTDNNGNYLSNTLTSVSGTSAALQSIETSFHQDLNGDGTIGPAGPPPPPAQTVIEGFGSTSLTEVGTHFYLYGSDGTGPSLKYQGADYVAGQFGQVAPIGAEQTASGYEVAWKVPGADQFSVWNTDNNGNYLSNTLTSVSGTSAALQSIEASFQQDLNGDGSIVLIGGPGNDNFVFHPGMGADTIVNFNIQADTIELDHFANAQTIQQLQTLITNDSHGDAVIALGHGDSVTLPGVNTSQLQQALASVVHLT